MSTDYTSSAPSTSAPAELDDAATKLSIDGTGAGVDTLVATDRPVESDAGHTDSEGDSDGGSDGDEDAPEVSGNSLLVREGDVAADYLETLLDIVDYDGDIDLDVENGRAIVAVVGSDLSPLVGPNGTTLDALQELTRLAVQQQTGVRSRLMLDVSGHRNQRRQQLTDLATTTAKTVVDSGQPVRLSPMNPFERKVVHDAISNLSGVESESEGDEPQRRVVVHPVG